MELLLYLSNYREFILLCLNSILLTDFGFILFFFMLWLNARHKNGLTVKSWTMRVQTFINMVMLWHPNHLLCWIGRDSNQQSSNRLEHCIFNLFCDAVKMLACYETRSLILKQSSKRNFVLKKTKLVLNSLTARYVISDLVCNLNSIDVKYRQGI